jgi:hypothetical protein
MESGDLTNKNVGIWWWLTGFSTGGTPTSSIYRGIFHYNNKPSSYWVSPICGTPAHDCLFYALVNSHSYEKSSFIIGRSTINRPCSIAMLNYQRVMDDFFVGWLVMFHGLFMSFHGWCLSFWVIGEWWGFMIHGESWLNHDLMIILMNHG